MKKRRPTSSAAAAASVSASPNVKQPLVAAGAVNARLTVPVSGTSTGLGWPCGVTEIALAPPPPLKVRVSPTAATTVPAVRLSVRLANCSRPGRVTVTAPPVRGAVSTQAVRPCAAWSGLLNQAISAPARAELAR